MNDMNKCMKYELRYELLKFVCAHSQTHSAHAMLVGNKKSTDLHDMQFVTLMMIIFKCAENMPT